MTPLWTQSLRAPLVLASASPRRTWILGQLGIEHLVDPADIDETAVSDADPEHLVHELSARKAESTSLRHPGSLVLGSDTVVYLEPDVLGKPTSHQEAVAMLGRLAGRTHVVWTGVHLARDGKRIEGLSVPNRVTFRPLGSREIEAYVATGDPLDKAGAYGIQGPGLGLVERLEGCYYAVAGLPVAATLQLLQKHG
jgi:septum formation protein